MKKGFTLVELLAVIAIIAVLSFVTVPIVISYTEHAKYSAFENGVKSVYDAAKIYITSYEENGDLPIGGIKVEELKKDLKNYDYISGSIYRNNEGSIYIENISNGTYCATGTKSDLNIIKGDCENLDLTPPALKLAVNNVTSSGGIVVASAKDNQSGILGYSYSLDGINYSEISSKTIYEIKNLKANQNVTLYVKAYNNKYDSKMSKDNPNYEEMINTTVTEKTINFTTTEIDKPTFKISTTESSSATIKILEIIYPKNIENYKYTYQIDNGNEVIVDGENTRITIDENCHVVAKIYYNNKSVTNDIRISGIDNEGPKSNIVYNTDWELSKKIKIEIIAETHDLPERPYSFDGGYTWQSDNFKIYVQNEILTNKLLVRDKLGNITNKFTINGSDSETNEISIEYTDRTGPNCEIELEGTMGESGWYISNVNVKFINLVDYAKYCVNSNCKVREPGSGIKTYSLTKNSITTSTKSITVTGTVIDNLDNKSTCSTTLKMDKVKPVAPVITASDNVASDGWHRNDFTLKFESYGSVSGIKYYEYTYNGKKGKASELTITEATISTPLKVKACNNAGVCGDEKTYIVNYDKCDSYRPIYDSWSSCSKSCGGGTQTRTVTNISTTGSGFVCSTKVETQACNQQSCCSSTKVSSVSYGGWGSCSASCGGGTQSRTVTNYLISNYDGSSCGTTTSTQQQSCNTGSCGGGSSSSGGGSSCHYVEEVCFCSGGAHGYQGIGHCGWHGGCYGCKHKDSCGNLY